METKYSYLQNQLTNQVQRQKTLFLTVTMLNACQSINVLCIPIDNKVSFAYYRSLATTNVHRKWGVHCRIYFFFLPPWFRLSLQMEVIFNIKGSCGMAGITQENSYHKKCKGCDRLYYYSYTNSRNDVTSGTFYPKCYITSIPYDIISDRFH